MKSSVAQEHAGYGLVDTFLSTGQNEIKAQEAIWEMLFKTNIIPSFGYIVSRSAKRSTLV